ncbi:PEP-CTERM sorting domain-containing protein [Stieleria magnilauensis]|uniref:PEP-CTERM sorting domain-containing protein n=1 Tax=Stieleria magnilauensis TaxID=2527963 RepID=UPI003AF43A1E
MTASDAKAGVVFDQIVPPPVFHAGSTLGLSQLDTNVLPSADPSDLRQDFNTFYDDFSFSSDLTVTSFSWLGGYAFNNIAGETIHAADKFQISIFADDSNKPALAPLYTFDVGTASETPLLPGYYAYSADVTPFLAMGGETYWFSVAAALPYEDTGAGGGNLWGIAFSDSPTGDGLAIERQADLVGDPFTTNIHTTDLSFSVSAVPEPSSLLAFAAIGLVTGLRRRRRRI